MGEGSYVALKSPKPDAASASTPPPTTSTGFATTLRFGVVLAIAVFVFGNIATWAPLYERDLINTFTKWWKGYPHGDSGGVHSGHAGSIMDTGVQRNISHTGHTEMVRPTFLFFFCILPFFLGVLMIELLHLVAPARRLTATFVWTSSAWLRRKLWLPFFGVSRFTVGEWLFGVVIVLGGNALCFWYEWDRRIKSAKASKILTTTKYWNIIGISFAYVCLYNMSLLLLPVTRNLVWMEFFNISYTNGSKLHRWLGYATVITAVIHMVGYWVKWVRDGKWQAYQLPCTSCDITQDPAGYYPWFNTFGFISTLAMVLMIPTSLPVVRRKMYEWFYITHWVLFLIAFFFAILHWGLILWWILPAGLLFFVSRAASTWNGIAPVDVDSLTVVGNEARGELVKLVLRRASNDKYDYKVGNFVYVNVPQVSKLQWHALTIASSPKTSAAEFTLLVKPLGDWSNQLAAYARECEATQQPPVVYMDGFYGASLQLYNEYSTVCLVGGGIGVTPLLAVLEDVAAAVDRAGSWTQPRVVFAFAFHDLSLLSVLAPVLLKLEELDPSREFFQARLFYTQEEPSEAVLDQAVARELDKKKTADKPPKARAFTEPLRSSATLRFTFFIVLYAIGILVVAGVRWGNGIVQGDNHPELWPLQRSVEMLLFCATIAAAFAFIWYEYVTRSRGESKQADAPEATTYATALEDVHSWRDLANRCQVVFGGRPDMQVVLQDVLSLHQSSSASSATLSSVGLIVSGPETLKVATNDAVVALGSHHFDVHEEEFEL
ncbi:unnamed protein product [Aphanomyces euteiches]